MSGCDIHFADKNTETPGPPGVVLSDECPTLA